MFVANTDGLWALEKSYWLHITVGTFVLLRKGTIYLERAIHYLIYVQRTTTYSFEAWKSGNPNHAQKEQPSYPLNARVFRYK